MSVIAFDIGGTNLRSALADDHGKLDSRRELRTPVQSVDALVDAIVAEARAQLAVARIPPRAIGVAMAGYTDTQRGLVYASPSLGLHETLLGPPLTRALELPVRLVNDVNAAAWGEARHWGSRDLVALFVGTGVGAGFVAGGTLVEGHHGMAAEAGHAIWREGGVRCPAGHAGCYQAYLGGKSLADRARAAGMPGDASTLIARWREGDAAASAIMHDAQLAMSALCRLLCTLMDPELIVISGGVARRTPELLETARAALDPHPLARQAGAVRVQAAALEDDAGLVGAAFLAAALVPPGC